MQDIDVGDSVWIEFKVLDVNGVTLIGEPITLNGRAKGNSVVFRKDDVKKVIPREFKVGDIAICPTSGQRYSVLGVFEGDLWLKHRDAVGSFVNRASTFKRGA